MLLFRFFIFFLLALPFAYADKIEPVSGQVTTRVIDAKDLEGELPNIAATCGGPTQVLADRDELDEETLSKLRKIAADHAIQEKSLNGSLNLQEYSSLEQAKLLGFESEYRALLDQARHTTLGRRLILSFARGALSFHSAKCALEVQRITPWITYPAAFLQGSISWTWQFYLQPILTRLTRPFKWLGQYSWGAKASSFIKFFLVEATFLSPGRIVKAIYDFVTTGTLPNLPMEAARISASAGISDLQQNPADFANARSRDIRLKTILLDQAHTKEEKLAAMAKVRIWTDIKALAIAYACVFSSTAIANATGENVLTFLSVATALGTTGYVYNHTHVDALEKNPDNPFEWKGSTWMLGRLQFWKKRHCNASLLPPPTVAQSDMQNNSANK